MVKRYLFLPVVILLCVLFLTPCFALEMMFNTGMWPDSWPKELEPYRESAKTQEVASGTQENIYEIPIKSQDEFEKIWPYVLQLTTKGSLVILENPSEYFTTGIRILAPSDGVAVLPDGTRLEATPPWPDYIKSPSGKLPEYVAAKYGKWIPWTPFENGFRYRARVDIIVVTDGKAIDPNRISVPPDVSVIEKNEIQDLKTYHNETYGFEVKYPENTFAFFPITTKLPREYKTSYSGVKLISVARANKLGKEKCYYGESGIPEICTAEMEGGIEFIPVDNSLQELVSSLDDSCRTNVTVAGRQSVCWSIGAEGEGTDYYYIPLTQNQTLIIVRLYRFNGFPKPDLFNQVISTLVIK